MAGATKILGGLSALAEKAAQKVKPKKKKAAVGTVFDDVEEYDRALSMAQRGDHLKRTPEGKYVGAPEWVDSPQALAKLRRDALASVERGAWNADWYIRQRDLAKSLSDDPAMQSLFARGTAAYSPQAMPKVELPAFLRQHNEKVLTGKDVRARTDSQMKNVAAGYEFDPEGLLHVKPGAIRLGKKTGPYAQAKDPNVADESLYRTANDIWHGRVMGYGDDFSRGFTPQEHGFLTGENLVLADAATKASIPVGDLAAKHTPRTAQAATWGDVRYRSLEAEDAARHAKQAKERARYEADPQKWRKKHPDAKSAPPKPQPVRTPQELREISMQGLDSAMPNQLAHLTNEAVTGSSVGHLPGMKDWPLEARQAYTDSVLAATGRDPTIEALGMYSLKPRPTLGEYVNKAGELERNPGWADPVAVSNLGKSRATPDAERGALDLASHISGLLRAQEMGAYSRLIPEGPGLRVGDMNAVQFSALSADDSARARDLARQRGFDPVEYGQGQMVVTKFGNEGPVAGAAKDLQRLYADKGLTFRRGLLEGNAIDTLGPEVGTGKWTTKMLERIDQSGIPHVYERLDRGRWPGVAKAYNEIDAGVAAERGLPLRDDLVKLRQIVAERGFSGLSDYVKKYGAAGLPAVFAGLDLSEADPGIEPARYAHGGASPARAQRAAGRSQRASSPVPARLRSVGQASDLRSGESSRAYRDDAPALLDGQAGPQARQMAGGGLATLAEKTERKLGLPEGLLKRLLQRESNWKADAVSPKGALGVAQFMPATAKEMGIDPLDPLDAIPAAGRYLTQLYGKLGSWDKALGAYNWGIGNVTRKGLERAPRETRDYIDAILGRARASLNAAPQAMPGNGDGAIDAGSGSGADRESDLPHPESAVAALSIPEESQLASRGTPPTVAKRLTDRSSNSKMPFNLNDAQPDELIELIALLGGDDDEEIEELLALLGEGDVAGLGEAKEGQDLGAA